MFDEGPNTFLAALYVLVCRLRCHNVINVCPLSLSEFLLHKVIAVFVVSLVLFVLTFSFSYEDDHVFELVLLMSLSIRGDVSLVLAVFVKDMLLYACFQCT